MLQDYHLHTPFCGHAKGEMEDYLREALKKNIKEIGFAGHFPLLHLKDRQMIEHLSIPEERFPFYVEKVLSLREKFPQLTIRLGCEVDFVPGYERKIEKILVSFPFDYVMLSVHFIGDFLFDHPAYLEEWKGKDIFSIYQQYFKLLKEGIKTGLFDVLAHPDLIKKFGFRPSQDLSPFYEEIAHLLKEKNMASEVNTSGLRRPVGEIYPSLELLKILRSYEIPAVIGSDAHSPEEVGKDLDKGIQWLKKAGYRELVSFSGRKFSPFPL